MNEKDILNFISTKCNQDLPVLTISNEKPELICIKTPKNLNSHKMRVKKRLLEIDEDDNAIKTSEVLHNYGIFDNNIYNFIEENEIKNLEIKPPEINFGGEQVKLDTLAKGIQNITEDKYGIKKEKLSMQEIKKVLKKDAKKPLYKRVIGNLLNKGTFAALLTVGGLFATWINEDKINDIADRIDIYKGYDYPNILNYKTWKFNTNKPYDTSNHDMFKGPSIEDIYPNFNYKDLIQIIDDKKDIFKSYYFKNTNPDFIQKHINKIIKDLLNEKIHLTQTNKKKIHNFANEFKKQYPVLQKNYNVYHIFDSKDLIHLIDAEKDIFESNYFKNTNPDIIITHLNKIRKKISTGKIKFSIKYLDKIRDVMDEFETRYTELKRNYIKDIEVIRTNIDFLLRKEPRHYYFNRNDVIKLYDLNKQDPNHLINIFQKLNRNKLSINLFEIFRESLSGGFRISSTNKSKIYQVFLAFNKLYPQYYREYKRNKTFYPEKSVVIKDYYFSAKDLIEIADKYDGNIFDPKVLKRPFSMNKLANNLYKIESDIYYEDTGIFSKEDEQKITNIINDFASVHKNYSRTEFQKHPAIYAERGKAMIKEPFSADYKKRKLDKEKNKEINEKIRNFEFFNPFDLIYIHESGETILDSKIFKNIDPNVIVQQMSFIESAIENEEIELGWFDKNKMYNVIEKIEKRLPILRLRYNRLHPGPLLESDKPIEEDNVIFWNYKDLIKFRESGKTILESDLFKSNPDLIVQHLSFIESAIENKELDINWFDENKLYTVIENFRKILPILRLRYDRLQKNIPQFYKNITNQTDYLEFDHPGYIIDPDKPIEQDDLFLLDDIELDENIDSPDQLENIDLPDQLENIVLLDQQEDIDLPDQLEDIDLPYQLEDIDLLDKQEDIDLLDKQEDIVLEDQQEDIDLPDQLEDIVLEDQQEDIDLPDQPEDIVLEDEPEDIDLEDGKDTIKKFEDVKKIRNYREIGKKDDFDYIDLIYMINTPKISNWERDFYKVKKFKISSFYNLHKSFKKIQSKLNYDELNVGGEIKKQLEEVLEYFNKQYDLYKYNYRKGYKKKITNRNDLAKIREYREVKANDYFDYIDLLYLIFTTDDIEKTDLFMNSSRKHLRKQFDIIEREMGFSILKIHPYIKSKIKKLITKYQKEEERVVFKEGHDIIKSFSDIMKIRKFHGIEIEDDFDYIDLMYMINAPKIRNLRNDFLKIKKFKKASFDNLWENFDRIEENLKTGKIKIDGKAKQQLEYAIQIFWEYYNIYLQTGDHREKDYYN